MSGSICNRKLQILQLASCILCLFGNLVLFQPDRAQTNTFMTKSYFSLRNETCPIDCAENCPVNMKAFVSISGEVLDRSENTLIGIGGEGKVYKAEFKRFIG